MGQNGIVQVYYSNQWGNICRQSFGSVAADVVCHQLGYTGGTSSTAGNSEYEFLSIVHVCIYTCTCLQCTSVCKFTQGLSWGKAHFQMQQISNL